ncbi:hypothetical protein GALMADRAFT_134092 [Galerina marginata CBS 339.88]|uniref:Uncharacterized protein n=1 Tax=Galerina marginata (strain CBS 339.88) TaxID=685588 RepID=A0A067TJK4_GALM3|nr:hypothetical protein GALMADRAFT_134092 [Galerina marginata CBS 339.88]
MRKCGLCLDQLPYTLEDYPVLEDKHMFAKNAASARKVGDGASTDSWLWTFGALRGMNDGEKAEFVVETEKVMWFRARADMERWVEEVDFLEEELRRLDRGCERMAVVWTSLTSVAPKYIEFRPEYLPSSPLHPGYRAYALQKAAMYREMAVRARDT